jgi:hypothetical protein
MPKTTIDLPERLNLRLAGGDKKRFQAAARKVRLSLSAWLRLAALEKVSRDRGSKAGTRR